jgi:hypothetical protein
LNDVSGQFIGTGHNSLNYTAGINGYGLALVLNGILSQCMIVNPYLNMSYISFTWEFWVYPTVSSTVDRMFIGQCSHYQVVDQCLIFTIRSNAMCFGFWGDDITGTTPIGANIWSHMAFVYDIAANKKSIYLNGVLEATKTSIGPLKGNSTIMTFGCRSNDSGNTYISFFTGFIDQLLYNSRIKNASEILDDATLVAYYRFLSTAPLIDSGPNYINGSWSGGAVSTASGIVDQAIHFPDNESYFQMTGLVLLGTSNWPLSLSLWFETTSLNGGDTIVYISDTSTSWCHKFIALTASGNVEIQIFNGTSNLVYTGPVMPIGVWNHVVYTFSETNGARLYVNGTLHGSIVTTYSASNSPYTLTFGNPLPEAGCRSLFPNQQFYGSIDEVRLYSREITASEVF